jgi:hypothetical protein
MLPNNADLSPLSQRMPPPQMTNGCEQNQRISKTPRWGRRGDGGHRDDAVHPIVFLGTGLNHGIHPEVTTA